MRNRKSGKENDSGKATITSFFNGRETSRLWAPCAGRSQKKTGKQGGEEVKRGEGSRNRSRGCYGGSCNSQNSRGLLNEVKVTERTSNIQPQENGMRGKGRLETHRAGEGGVVKYIMKLT